LPLIIVLLARRGRVEPVLSNSGENHGQNCSFRLSRSDIHAA
jgi:hypothetical protein